MIPVTLSDDDLRQSLYIPSSPSNNCISIGTRASKDLFLSYNFVYCNFFSDVIHKMSMAQNHLSLTRLRNPSLICAPSPCCTRVVTTGAVVLLSSARPTVVVHRIGGRRRVGRTFGGVDDLLAGYLALDPFFRRHATPPLSDLFTLDGRHCWRKIKSIH